VFAQGKQQAGAQAVAHGCRQHAGGIGPLALTQGWRFIRDDVTEIAEVDLEDIVFQ